MRDNWYAFAVAAYYSLLPEQAFAYLDLGYHPKKYTSTITENTMPESEIYDMLVMKDQGYTWEQIGEVYNIEKSAAFQRVKRFLKKQGVEHLRQKCTDEDVRSMIRMREEGYTWKQIGDQFNMTDSGVLNKVKRYSEKKEACLK